MAGFAPHRPLVSLPFLIPSINDSVSLHFARHQSSYRRTVKKLRVKPAAFFAPTPGKTSDHIIFNPPSSAPSVYQTPNKFLPKDDIRRTLTLPTSVASTAGTTATTSTTLDALPPPISPPYKKKYHLTQADVEEVRRLRASDPWFWSQHKLAAKFDCSKFFISRISSAPEEKKEVQRQVLEAVKARWGPRRLMAREDRKIRKATWGRG